MKILVFGGTFDPPHAGHSALLAAACRRIDPDWVVLVPAWRNPLKAKTPARPSDRLLMIQLGLLEAIPGQWRKRAWIHTDELKSRRPVFTVDTLRALAADFPAAELHFALGWDSAAQWRLWKEPARLKALARWWTARRPGCRGQPPSFIHRLNAAMPDVSATDLRAQLELGEPTAKAISPAVLAYIQKRGLYGQGRLSRLRSMLNPERFEHSRCVARLAGSLAKRWGQDPELALTAGMLHDCGRSIPAARMGSYAKRHRLKLPQLEATARLQPLAVHAHISERLARSVFGIENSAVLSAIRKHTLADRRMSPLDKVLYVADACSQDRSYPEAPSLRKLAFEDLDEAYKGCLRNKIEYCLRHDFWLHPLTLTAWNSLAR